MKEIIEWMFLPIYSPELNLIERLLGWLKSSVINNVFFSTLLKIRIVVSKFIDKINKVPIEKIDRLCVKM